MLTPVLALALHTRPGKISKHTRLYAHYVIRLELKHLNAHQQWVERTASEVGDDMVLDVLIVGERMKRRGHAHLSLQWWNAQPAKK
jgi:hypothetical protein